MMPAENLDQLVLAMVEASQQPTLAEAAMAYARAGIHIFPTQPGDKKPLFGSSGHLDATCDLDKVREWWTKHPQANIACSPGRSGFLVIDIDGPDRKEEDGTLKLVADGRKTWAKLRSAAGDSSPYLRTLSPGKGQGQHAWYRYPLGMRIGAPKLTDAPGLQAFGVLGYVMLAPSVHPEGPSYTFATDSYQVTDVPKWLLEHIPETSTGSHETATDEQTEAYIADHSGYGLSRFWRLAVDAQGDEIREADLRHPAVLSAVARVVGWASEHPGDFDLAEALEVLQEATDDAFTGEQRNPKRELRRSLNWVIGQQLASEEEERVAEETARFSDWPELKPLKSAPSDPVSLDHLPRGIRKMVETVAEHTQTPPEHAMLASLSTLSAATVGKACVDMSWREPGALWTISVAPPSDRKSAVTQLVASTPLTEAMAAMAEELAPAVREAEAEAKAAGARLATVEKNMGRDNPTATVSEWADAKAALDAVEQPALPAFLISDATPEAIEIVMAEQRGAAAVVSAEGALVSSLAGRYTEKQKARVGPLNSAFSAEAIHTRRVKGGRTIPRPHLSMTLIIQPTVLMEMGGTASFVESGFFARFLYALPDSKVGRRGNRTPVLDESAVSAWGTTVAKVLSRFWSCDEPVVLPMDSAGLEIVQSLRARVERILDQSSTSPAEHYWLGKAVGQVGRIALMFTLSENPAATRVPAEHVQRAAGVFDYLWTQARLAFGQSVELEGGNLEFAKAIVRWVERRDVESFTAHEVRQSGPGRWRGASDEEREATLKLLEEHGYLRQLPEPPRGPKGGRPSSSQWVVSPRVGAQESATSPEVSATSMNFSATLPETCDETPFDAESESFEQPPVQTNEGPKSQENEVSYQRSNFPNIKREYTTTTPNGCIAPSRDTSLYKQAATEPLSDHEEINSDGSLATVEINNKTADDGSEEASWDEWCNPNLSRKSINPTAADGFPSLNADGSCSRCGSDDVSKLGGFVICSRCGTSYTALVVSGD